MKFRHLICKTIVEGPEWFCRIKHDWTDWALMHIPGETPYSWHRRMRTCARCGKHEEAIIDYWAD